MWAGGLHFRGAGGGGRPRIIGRRIQDDEFSAIQGAEAVSPGFQGLTANLESNLVEQVALVFFTNGSGIAGAVNEARQNIKIVSKMHAAGVAKLRGSGLAAEKDAFRKNLPGDVGGLEQHILSGGRIGTSGRQIMPHSGRQAQKVQGSATP